MSAGKLLLSKKLKKLIVKELLKPTPEEQLVRELNRKHK